MKVSSKQAEAADVERRTRAHSAAVRAGSTAAGPERLEAETHVRPLSCTNRYRMTGLLEPGTAGNELYTERRLGQPDLVRSREKETRTGRASAGGVRA